MKLPWQKKEEPEQGVPQQSVVDKIQDQLAASVSWKRSQGYYNDWPTYERFKRGQQWPEVTADTEIMPRPVVNIFESIIDQKVSAVMAEEQQITFLPREGAAEEDIAEMLEINPDAPIETADNEAADMFNKAAKHTAEVTENEELNEEVCDTAAVLGTGGTYWWWNSNKRGGNPERGTAFEGEIAGDVLDPADLHLGNPREKNVQKQPWIILTVRTPIDSFRDFYQEHSTKLGVDVNSIQPSKEQKREQMYDAERTEIDSGGYVDEIRRFQKVMNHAAMREEIWYDVVVDGKHVRQERPLFKNIDKQLYPIALFRWKDVRNCSFGEGESRNIIEAQKALNRLLAMAIWNGYLTAWAKVKTKKGALERPLTNMPGEQVTDLTPPGGWGVDYMNPPAIPAYVQQLFNELPEMVKTEAGVHEAMTGASPKEMNAAAIMMLQKAAGVRIAKISRNFRRYQKDVAQIWEMMWKEFYTERRLIRITEDGNRSFFWFRATDYSDFDFDVSITATPTASYSEGMTLTELKEHLDAGRITFEQYLENVPKSVLPMADKLLEELKKAQQMGAQMAQQQSQQQQEIVSQLPPDQQAQFMQMPPEQQQAFIQQATGQMPQQPPQVGM